MWNYIPERIWGAWEHSLSTRGTNCTWELSFSKYSFQKVNILNRETTKNNQRNHRYLWGFDSSDTVLFLMMPKHVLSAFRWKFLIWDSSIFKDRRKSFFKKRKKTEGRTTSKNLYVLQVAFCCSRRVLKKLLVYITVSTFAQTWSNSREFYLRIFFLKICQNQIDILVLQL